MSKKFSAIFLLLAGVSYGHSLLVSLPNAHAAELRDVVISEIAWAGSSDSASDEWIELYNNTNQAIDLNNWLIEDDSGAQTYPLQGSIPAHSYFLLESREIATSLAGDVIKTTSLSNAGDGLVLKDASQHIVDSVNNASAAWYAGSSTSHATMERINLQADGDLESNWQNAAHIATATSSAGSPIVGSPRAANNTDTSATITSITTNVSPSILHSDQDITVNFDIQNAANISNFGFDIDYDQSQLNFVSATEGDFLKTGGTTSFQAGLLNNQPGTIVIGSARTEKPLTGKDGGGTLFTLTFHTLTTAHGNTMLTIKTSSFLSTPTSHIDIPTWPSTTLTIQNSAIPTISNLQATPGSERYSIVLTWDSTSSGPFQIYRQDRQSNWQLLGTSTTNSFIDHDGIMSGGNIIPLQEYQYRVGSGDLSSSSIVTGTDIRGLRADNNRTDRVDGNDLEQIARLWTVDDSDSSFQPRVDTNVDGLVGGEDLLDLAVDWAKTYQ